MPNISPGGAYLPTTVTYAQAKARVARSIQGSSQANALSEAGECIGDAVRWWNHRDWKLLMDEAASITVSANVSDYDLPTDFKHAYTVRLAQAPLFFLSQRDWDRYVYDQTGTSGSTHYTTARVGAENKIRLVPTPSAEDTLSINYYKALTIPSQDDAELGWPDMWVEPILSYARSLLCAERGMTAKSQFYMAQALAGYRRCRAQDLVQPDQEITQQPAPNGAYPPGTSWYYVREHYGF